jgi:hypothetical protein
MLALAGQQLEVATLRYCSGLVETAALGVRERVKQQLWVGIWQCCSGLVAVAVLGMRIRVEEQQQVVI